MPQVPSDRTSRRSANRLERCARHRWKYASFSWGHSCESGPFTYSRSALGVGRELRLLIHVDPVAVKILERHPGPVGLHFGLAFEANTRLRHPPIFADAIVGHDPEQGLGPTLLADQQPLLVRLGQDERNR